VLTQNLCQNTATLSLKQSATLDFIAKNNKAGSAVINAKICIGSSSICIRKSQSVTVLAGPVAKINITTPTSIVMNEAQMPINITAQDAYDNPLGQTVEQYTISPSTGTINGETSLTINNFADASFIYQAPDTVAGNMPVVLTITGTNNDDVLISGTQNIIVAKGILNISYLHQLVYSTNVNSVNRAMGYTLPNSNSDLVQEDVNNIAQIQETALPQISLLLQDRNGNKLDSVLTISSKNNLLTPGVVQDTTLQLSGTTQTQKTFQKQSNFLIKDGVANITFYPTLKAGREEMILNVP